MSRGSQIFARSAIFLDRHDTSSGFPRLLGLEPHTPRFRAISRSSRDSARHQPPCVASGTYTKPRNIVQPPSLRGSKALLAHVLTSRWIFWGRAVQSRARSTVTIVPSEFRKVPNCSHDELLVQTFAKQNPPSPPLES